MADSSCRKSWKICCKCGAITDFDEKNCPRQCEGNTLESIRLPVEEIRRLSRQGQVFTKNQAGLEKILS